MKGSMLFRRAIAIGTALGAASAAPAQAAASCEALLRLRAPEMTITGSQAVASVQSIAPELAPAPEDEPFCRATGYLSPTADSHIQFEVWLPAKARWNGKFLAVGNGGFFGYLNHRAALSPLRRNYAVLTTDLGHTSRPGDSSDGSWAIGHPNRVVDYAYRAQHVSVAAAKTIIAAHYGSGPTHSYFSGCSAGGIQGLTELLRYPDDFDGYVIGNATPDHLGQELGAMWNTLIASLSEPAEALTPAHAALIHRAVLMECAGKDGGLASDGFLTDPRVCAFDPASLQCKPGQDPQGCLSEAQVANVRRIYLGPVNPRTSERYLAGLTPGTEDGWSRYFVGKTNPAKPDRPWSSFLQYMAHADPTYLDQMKYLAFDFDRDVEALRGLVVGGETLESSWNTRNRDLGAFAAAGGKVIQYHGWGDPNIPPLEAIRFRDELLTALRARTGLSPAEAEKRLAETFRLFMVPGMGHCSGGAGAWSFGQVGETPVSITPEHDTLSALEAWVERGEAPWRFVGSRPAPEPGQERQTRPICAFPRIPVWNGEGSKADAANFACIDPHNG